jgi:hypothetical protein
MIRDVLFVMVCAAGGSSPSASTSACFRNKEKPDLCSGALQAGRHRRSSRLDGDCLKPAFANIK